MSKDEQDPMQELCEKMALLNVDNFGPPTDMWVPDYGWVLVKGEVTKEGVEWFNTAYPEQLKKDGK